MQSIIDVFGLEIPVYGLCWILGIGMSAVVAFLLKPKADIKKYDLVYSAVFAVIGGLIGSKLLFLAVSMRQIIEQNIPFEAVIKGGFVFYGGLIGGILGLFIYTRMFKMKALPIADIFAVVLPLGHACGRVGCHIAGCCYGMEYSGPFCVTYTNCLGDTPLNVPLFPVQLLESVILLLMFAVLLIVYNKTKKSGVATAVYLYSYAVVRFILEFFRGDMVRGVSLGLSTSQMISLLIIVVLTAVIIYRWHRMRKKV